ncbi:MAG: lipoprotein signal peptidase [Sulfurovum sp.]|nr:MAG: lipoprotein signal peptidase [Sulfurovum sp.]
MRGIIVFLSLLVSTFLIDQAIKTWAVDTAYQLHQVTSTSVSSPSEDVLNGTLLKKGKCINLELYFNKGVAFSMFAFLGTWMKWIQGGLVLILIFIIFKEKYYLHYAIPAGLLVGGALGNVYDRFIHQGVVDYIAWHCGFKYAVFNYADIAIDVAFVLILVMVYFSPKKSKIK